MKPKISNCDETKKNSNCDKTQNSNCYKIFECEEKKSKAQNVTKHKL